MDTRRNTGHDTVLLETALTAVVFAIVLFAAFDFARMYTLHARLQRAVSECARFASLGSRVEDPEHPGESLSHENSITYMIRALSGIDELRREDIHIHATSADGTLSAGVGSPGDLVTVRADWRVPVVAPFLYAMFPGGRYEFSATTDFRRSPSAGDGAGETETPSQRRAASS